MLGIPGLCERPRQYDDRRDGRRDSQAADEQNTFRSTIHRRIPTSMRALGSGAHHGLSGVGHVESSSLACRLFPPPILGAASAGVTTRAP